VRLTAAFLIFSTVIFLPNASAAERPARWQARNWIRTAERVAKVAACASQAADVLSSYRDSRLPGLHETNAFYAPGGRFSIDRMIGVKSGICAAILLGSRISGPSEGAALGWATIGAGISIPTAYSAINNMRLK
jgi:hypothetical protein